MFYDIYISLCNSIQKAPTAVASDLGFTAGTVHFWKNGSTPRDATLNKIAEYFGVTVEYLKGQSAESKKENPSIPTSQNTGVDDFMKLYAMLSPERQAILRDQMLELMKEQMQG